jgi:hypothetical protein
MRHSSRFIVRVIVGALMVAAVSLAMSRPALAQITGCSYQQSALPAQIQNLRNRLKQDSFAAAYNVYIHDLDTLDTVIASLVTDINKAITECASLNVQIQRYNADRAAYLASECGAATAPIEVVNRCQARASASNSTRDSLIDQWNKLNLRWMQLVIRNNQLVVQAKPAIEHAELVLDPDHVEDALRLYISFVQKRNSGNSCQDFADIAEKLGQRVLKQEYFLKYLVRNLSGNSPGLDWLVSPGPAKPFVFDASGFLQRFYAHLYENQIRHALAYMAFGYRFTGTSADLFAYYWDKREGEIEDYQLGVEAGHMGFQLRRGVYNTRNFGSAIRTKLCS